MNYLQRQLLEDVAQAKKEFDERVAKAVERDMRKYERLKNDKIRK